MLNNHEIFEVVASLEAEGLYDQAQTLLAFLVEKSLSSSVSAWYMETDEFQSILFRRVLIGLDFLQVWLRSQKITSPHYLYDANINEYDVDFSDLCEEVEEIWESQDKGEEEIVREYQFKLEEILF